MPSYNPFGLGRDTRNSLFPGDLRKVIHLTLVRSHGHGLLEQVLGRSPADVRAAGRRPLEASGTLHTRFYPYRNAPFIVSSLGSH